MHDPGKVLLDGALGVALGRDCLADVAMLRAEPDAFGPVASDPTVSRLVDALGAIRSAWAEVRARLRELTGANGPVADGQVIVDFDGVLVLAHCEKQDATVTCPNNRNGPPKKPTGRHEGSRPANAR